MASRTITEELQAGLLGLFSIADRPSVDAFLCANDFLLPLLMEAGGEINRRFPGTGMALELMTDPEGMDAEQLFLYICTTLPPSEARPKLKELDRDWWLSALKRAHGKLCISLEYQ
jgi:hypothetical protein